MPCEFVIVEFVTNFSHTFTLKLKICSEADVDQLSVFLIQQPPQPWFISL